MMDVVDMKLACRDIRVSVASPASRRLSSRVALESAVTVMAGPDLGIASDQLAICPNRVALTPAL